MLLNWKRPANLTRIVAAEAAYKSVEEILVFNNNTTAAFHYPHPKVNVLNASTDFGLRVRWILAALARSECLIFQDDDILLPESTVRAFIDEVDRDGQRVYSLHGRNPRPDGQYDPAVSEGEVEIALTRAAAIHRSLVPVIFQSEEGFRAAGFELPLNNGEDIFLSYCITAKFGKKHKVLRLPFADLAAPHALSSRPEHIKERTHIVRQCKRFFFSPGLPDQENRSPAGRRASN